MKKALSLLLAAVMALTLCVTAFAGGDTGTRVYLTGDAADEVTGLTSGQRIDAGGSTTVRLNVQSDPGAEEYTVKLDGEALKADHSTAQYHVYSLPADKLTAKTATLSVNGGVSTQAAQTASVTVRVNGVDKVVELPADGSTDHKNPTALTADYAYEEVSGDVDRVFFKDPSEGVTLCTGFVFSTGDISGSLTLMDEGYTGQQLFFYKDPKSQSKTAYVLWTDGEGVKHYYTVSAKRAAQPGYVLAPNMLAKESDPGNANTYDTTTGYVTMIFKGYAQAPFSNYDLALFNDGKASTTTTSPVFPTDEAGLYYLKDGTTAYFARPGRYWLPASVEKDGMTYTGEAPFMATWTLTSLNAQLEKAKAVQASDEFKALPDSVQAQFNAIVDRLTTGSSNMSGSVMVNAAGKITTGDDVTDIQARDFGGKQILTERLLEGDECALLDLMAIFETYKTDKALGQYQAEAYAKIAALNVNSFTDVTTAAQKTLYSQVKQAKWELLKTTDLEGINKILTSLKLDNITPAKPQVTLGDINGDGKVCDVMDVTLIIEKYIGTLGENETFMDQAADVNCDGRIDVLDVTEMIEMYIGTAANFSGAKNANGGE